MNDVHGRGRGHGDALLGPIKVSCGHARNPRKAFSGPSAHVMWVLLCVRFDGLGRAAVAVAFAQNWVHGRAFHFVVFRLDVTFHIVARIVGVVRQVKALLLQFGNRRLQLGNGSTDVGKLDNVGLWCFGQRTQLGQGVVGGLVLGQHLSHGRKDAAAKGDVTRFHRHACFRRKGLNDGKKTVGCQGRSLVRKGVKNLGHAAANVGKPRRRNHFSPRPFASRDHLDVL